MPLPYYNNIRFKNSYDPIYDNLVIVNFDNNILLDNCFSIEKDIIKFNLFMDNGELVPYNIIKEFIDNKKIIKYLEIIHYNKYGEMLFSVFLKNFSFINFFNLVDFNWEVENDIKKLNVVFKYEEEYVIMAKYYNKFIRKIKLENINDNT